jgi:hypothetical protein
MKSNFLIIVMLILLSINSCINNTQTSNNQHNFTIDMYDKISTGMSYRSVVNIMLQEGKLTFEGTNPGIEGVVKETVDKVYIWANNDGSSINITFEDGKVYQKMQSGL